MSGPGKILYIDDEIINVKLFVYNFSKRYELLTGYCGEEGLELLEQYPDIKVVISDMRMPGMNGLEFVAAAKERFPDKAYFLLTGYDVNPEIREALDKKLIQKYLRKPFMLYEIEAAIKEHLG